MRHCEASLFSLLRTGVSLGRIRPADASGFGQRAVPGGVQQLVELGGADGSMTQSQPSP